MLYTLKGGGGKVNFVHAVLEYRLKKGANQFVPIYYYSDIDLGQILARRECEFFVKGGITYKQLSSAVENQLFVIYVEVYEEGPIEVEQHKLNAVTLEIRELDVRKSHPLIATVSFDNHLDVLSIIGSVYTYCDGKEWERDSAEIDEDRKVYVLYTTATGYMM